MTGKYLELRNVALKVDNKDMKRSEKQIMLLNGMNVNFMSGKITAVMGASGSGKTTLMSLIAGYVHSNSLTCGSILHEEKERGWNSWLKKMVYLEQDDCSIPKQTVGEFMQNVIRMRTGKTKNETDMEHKVVNDVMKKLHIDKIKGMLMEAISGGERKRVMIAAEMVVGADVLLLDEPTSGLDSHLALNLIMGIRDYAKEHNKIVIVTIHQPGPGLFDLFDDLLFMNKGSVVYFGQVSECDEFLKKNGVERKGKLSLSEFLFELFSEDSMIPEVVDNKEKIQEIAKAAAARGEETIKGKDMTTGTRYKVCLLVEPKKSLQIALRHMAIEWRTWEFLRSRAVEMLFLLFIFGFLPYFVLGNIMAGAYVEYNHHNDFKAGLPIRNTKFIYDMNFKEIIELYRQDVDPSLHSNMLETPLVEYLGFNTNIFGLMPCTSMLGDLSYITREVKKGAYGILTLYLSVFIAEIPLIVYRCFAICMIYFGIGMGEGVTSYFVIRLFITFIFMLMTNVMLRCMFSPKNNAVLYSACNLIIHTIMAITTVPITLHMLSCYPCFSYFKNAIYFVLLFWPFKFFNSLMEIEYVKKVWNDEIINNEENIPYKYFLKVFFLWEPDVQVMTHKILFTYSEAINDDEAINDYAMWMYGCAGIVMVVGVSLFLLGRRVSPQMRLKLSK
ncbi:White-like ABC transporter [Ordospora colligata]|nr:White-like ABC transporter [Ordospora colligata]